MKKRIVFALCIIMTFSGVSKVKAQDPETVAVLLTTGVSVTKKVYSGGQWIYSHREQISRVFRFMLNGFRYDHRWWACIYQDGFVTYNNFRSYRTSIDAYDYFVEGHGDDDAITQNNNHVSYRSPSAAKRLTDQHGAIVDIKYQDNGGRWVSSFD